MAETPTPEEIEALVARLLAKAEVHRALSSITVIEMPDEEKAVHFLRALQSQVAILREKVGRLTTLLDDQFGTPCEQIRHQEQVATLTAERDAARAESEKRGKNLADALTAVAAIMARKDGFDMWSLRNGLEAALSPQISPRRSSRWRGRRSGSRGN